MSGLLSQAIIGAGGGAALARYRFVVGFFLFGAHFARAKAISAACPFPLVFSIVTALRLHPIPRPDYRRRSMG